MPAPTITQTESADSPASAPESTSKKPSWVKVVAKYQTPKLSASMSQIVNSFGPYFVVLLTMYATVKMGLPYWVTLGLSLLAGGFLIRIFIIQHDCGHTSFFKTKTANDRLGFICGVLTMTPYEFWRTGHAIHHATSGDLDFRGIGDVETKTVKEYMSMTPMQRLGYRLYRNPLVMFGLGPAYMFMINQRTPIAWFQAPRKKGRRSLLLTDLALILYWGAFAVLFGLDNVLKVQIPVNIIAGTIGVWLFYVQHNFEDTYWRLHPEWDYTQAALQGSSYYKLPKILQWFSGNIGLHHIHHLSPRIPNYLLEQAHRENPEFQNVPTLTLKKSFEILTSRLALWDESGNKMVSFGYVHQNYKNELKATKITNPETVA
jgi:acyl-lipid omega-6 desaturase (Delta-12 desaturase)